MFLDDVLALAKEKLGLDNILNQIVGVFILGVPEMLKKEKINFSSHMTC